MINKFVYLNKINNLKEIGSKYQVSDSIYNKIENSISEINDFSLKILLIGGFSAGKSALLNAAFSRELLEENQRPETAIACELIYNKEEYVELIDKDDNVKVSRLDELDNYNQDDYNYYRYYINNDFLSKYPSYTLVDMPGYNSGIERHNKAILQYVGQGNAYILVIDGQDGGVKSSAIEFIREIKQYDDNLVVIVSKKDKIPEIYIDEIVDSIKKTVSNIFEKDILVLSTSKFDNNVVEELDKCIRSFDSQDLFEQKFREQIFDIGDLCHKSIKSIAKSAELDVSEIDKVIEIREREKKKLIEKFEKERKKLSKKLMNQTKFDILKDINDALYGNLNQLISSINIGGDSFSRVVNNTLRPVLISSTEKYIEESFNEFVADLDFSDVFSDDIAKGLADEISDKYEEVSPILSNIFEGSNKVGGAYKAIMSALAITTSVVAPWIELIIVFLPDILKFTGKASQSKQKDAIKNKVEVEVIPSIVSRISPNIEESLKEIEVEIIENIKQKIEEQILVETEALDKAKEMKKIKEEEYKKMLENIEKDLEKVNEIITTL